MKPRAANFIITNEKVLSRTELQSLFAVCQRRTEQDLAKKRTTWPTRSFLVWFVFHTGLRVSEVANLKIGTINLTKQVLVVIGKGRKRREVPFNQDTSQRLKSYLAFKQQVLRQSVDPNAFLFANKREQAFTTRSLEISFKKALKAAGLSDHYYIHCARHTHATFLLKQTGNLRFVQKVLGHASIHTTSLYADILAEDTVRLANMLELFDN